MFARNRSLGVDIGDDAIRIVELQAAGNTCEVTLAAFLPLTAGEASDEVLAAFFRDERVGHGRVACGLPAADCAVKTASLPPAAPAELAQVVRFEAETQFPLPLPEMVWHYTLSPGPEGRPHAVIVGARRVVVDARMALLQDAGRMPGVLLPAPLAAARAVAHPECVHLFVQAGVQWSDLCLFDGDRLLSCRSVLAGSPDADEWAPRIMREARPWLVGADGPAQVLLAGVAMATGALAQATGLPVTLANPWQGVRDPNGFQQALDDAPAAYAAAIGLALAAGHRGTGLNLLPERVTQAKADRNKLGWALAALLLAAGLLAPVVYQGHQRLQARQAALQAVEADAARARKALPPAPGGGLMAAQQVTQALAAPESQPLGLLRDLSAKLPAAVTLANYSYDRGKGVLTLKGHADAAATVADALSAVTDLAGVTRAMLDSTTAARDGKGYDFQITCLLTAAADPTVMRAKTRAGEAR